MRIKSIINKLKFWKKATVDDDTQKQITTDSNFTTLAPKILEGKSLEENKIYLEALKEAVQIPENKNIALMGAYGSGKSSIMKTFEKNNPNHKYLFLSLASFLEKNRDENKRRGNQNDTTNTENGENQSTLNEGKSSETWEKIEKILVKQMIYKKTIKELPYSRFSRITKISNWTFLVNAVLLFFLISMLTNVNVVSEKFNSEILTNNTIFILVALISVYFIYLILEYLSKILKLSKFSFKSLTIETVNDESSYFSKYLDEIIYYFEVSKTDIVVIEDIDRFNSVVIFEHLRELNYLLNNSNQIDQPVRFIYAVRDDLFNNEGESNLKESEEYLRTKFFDFIIPVIPVVDYMNSREFLVPKVMSIINNNFLNSHEELEDSIKSGNAVNELNDNEVENTEPVDHTSETVMIANGSEHTSEANLANSSLKSNFKHNFDIKKFLMTISLYIDDLRLIYNICNEFEIYIKKLPHIDTAEDLMKLFSLIVYKNIYPEDFSSLQRKGGNLYDVFHSIKISVLDDIKTSIDKSIKDEKDIIDSSNYEVSISARTAILQMCLREFGQEINLYNVRFNKDTSNSYSSTNVIPLTDSVINSFLTAKTFIQLKYSSNQIEVPKAKIEEYFKYFGVYTNKIIGELEEEEKKSRERRIKQLENEKEFVSTISIKEIFENEYDEHYMFTKKFDDYNLLMGYLLSEGHIDETYNYYISNLYGDVLNTNDITIIKKLKSNTPLDAAEEITDYKLVMYELSENDYKKTAILNPNIILHIFNKSNYDIEQKNMANAFNYKLDNKKKVEILKELFKHPHNQTKKFISLLLKQNTKLYSVLYGNERTDTEFNKLLEYHIFGSADIKLLQYVVNDNPTLQPDVEGIENFVLNLYSDFDVNEVELNNFFADNAFKFKEAGLSEMGESHFEYYVINHLYQINTKNVFDIYERITSKSHEQFSLTELFTSELKELTQHINENFNEYIQLLNGREYLYEDEKVLIRILNESEVSEELKNDIIKNNISLIDDISAIKDLNHRKSIFQYEKYHTCLKNVMKAVGEELNYISPYFEDESKVKQFIEEASDMSELESDFIEELQSFLIMLVNEYGQEVNEINIELFKYIDEYSTEKINDLTFETLLNAERLKPTTANINELSGKNKIKLMALDETIVSQNFQNIEFDEQEILMGISVFDNELRNKIIAKSFKNGKLIVSNKVKWLKEILNNEIELSSEQINNLFLHEEILDDNTILEYLVFVIPKNILTEPDLLRNLYSIDKDLTAIQRGSRLRNKVDKKYYDVLKTLEVEEIISSVEIKDDKAVFYNKHK